METNKISLTYFLLRTLPTQKIFHPRRVKIRKCQFKLFDTENSDSNLLLALFHDSFQFVREGHPRMQQYQISTTKNIQMRSKSLFSRGMGFKLTAQYEQTAEIFG